eukprot:scaffold3224_cov158-Amphora_coffeaeformis.AAC.17
MIRVALRSSKLVGAHARRSLASPLVSVGNNAHAWTSLSSSNHSEDRRYGGILYLDRRCFSASSGRDDNASTSISSNQPTDPSVDETLNKLFAENSESAADALQAVAETWSPTWYNFADQAVVAVQSFHDLSGLEYGWSIVGVTLIMRLGLFPLMVMAQRTSSRMAHVQPELNQMKARYEALGTPSRQDQQQFGNKVRNLFKRYDVNPIKAMVAPIVQLPLFMGMFFGLQKIDRIYPEELATGGILWFPDLTTPDPYYALPILSGVTMLGMMELGKDQMTASNPAQGQMMLNIFRVFSIAMIPFLMTFDASMLCYWTANNTLTLVQTAFLQQKAVRDYFGIWERPKPVPGQETPSIKEMMENLVKRSRGEATSEKQEIERHNQAVETKKRAEEMMRQARQKRRGITGKRNI